jgi:hypothetical protein
MKRFSVYIQCIYNKVYLSIINMEQFSRMDTDCTSHFSSLKKCAVSGKCEKVKQSPYRPGQALWVPER